MNGSQENSPEKSAQPAAKPLPSILPRPIPRPQPKTGVTTLKPPSATADEPVQVIAEPVASAGDKETEQSSNQDVSVEQDPFAEEVVTGTDEAAVSDQVTNPELDQVQDENSAAKDKSKRSGTVLEESKNNSSGNAITHGIMSMRLLRDESADEFKNLYNELSAKYPPQGPLEKLCLERILMYHYRLRRLWRIEAEMMEHLMNQEQKDGTAENLSLGASIQREFNQAVSFESLQRYEAAIERQLRRAIGELLVLQKIIPQIEGDPMHVAAFLRQLG